MKHLVICSLTKNPSPPCTFFILYYDLSAFLFAMSFFFPPAFRLLPPTFNLFPSAFFILCYELTAMSYELSIPSYLPTSYLISMSFFL